MAVTYTGDAWVDVIAERLEAVIVAASGLSADRVFLSFADPKDLIEKAPADQFVALAPASLPVAAGIVAGAGAAHTAFDAVWNLDVYSRLGTDRELRFDRHVRDTRGLAALVFKLMDGDQRGVQLHKLADASDVSPLREPCRVLSVTFNGTRIGPGWAWARVALSVKMRTDLS